MAWTAEDRRMYAPIVQEMVRQGMLVRLAAMIDRIDPPSRVGRPRLWSTLIMLQALWHLARDGCAWRRLPTSLPPHPANKSAATSECVEPFLALAAAGGARPSTGGSGG